MDYRRDVVNFLVANGAPIDGKDHLGDTPLMHLLTAVDGDERDAAVPMLEHLLELGANPNASDSDGWSALTVAVDEAWIEAVRILLAHNADPNFTVDGTSPMSLAKEHGNQQIMKILELAGAR